MRELSVQEECRPPARGVQAVLAGTERPGANGVDSRPRRVGANHDSFPGSAMSKVAAVVLSMLAVAPMLEAQGSAGYAPGSHRYRVVREARSTQEMMGTTQAGTVTTHEEFTLELAASGRDTLRFAFTIDSASRQSDLPGPGEAPLPKGRRITGRMATRGSFHAFDTAGASTDDIPPGYRSFLPILPAEPLKTGVAWTDTVRTPFTQAGIQGTTQTIITSRVLGDTTIGERKAWRIERTGALSMSGAGDQDGAGLVLAGGGSAAGFAWVGMDGTYLGGSSTQDLALRVEVPAANLMIPIKQTSTTRIERLGGPRR